MRFLDTLQTQSKEDATKALFNILNSKAMDALSSVQEADEHKPGSYSDKNPKIDLHNKHNGEYIASTNWSPTVKHAVAGYEKKHPDMKGSVRGYYNKGKNESVEYFHVDEGRKIDKFLDSAGKRIDSVDRGLDDAIDSGTDYFHRRLNKKVRNVLTRAGDHIGDTADSFTRGLDVAIDSGADYVQRHVRGYYNKGKNESVEYFQIDEGVRGIANYSKGRHQASTYKDSDTGEYRVKFMSDGKHLKDADYFTDDKKDAEGTAKHQVDQLHAKDSK
jgi:hypothetical protein